MWRSPSSLQIHQKYIYMWNNSYRTPTEHWQETSAFPKGKKLPTYLGKRKKKKQRQKNRDRTCTSGRDLWRRKSFHTLGSPFTGGDGGGRREASEPRRRAQQQGCRGQSGEIPAQRIGADQHSPAWEACLLTRRGGRGLRAEALASAVRFQGEDWGWLQEHSLKGASAPCLARRQSGKKSGTAEEARDHCFVVREETGFRAPPKRAPETGASRGYQRRHQRQAWDAKAAAAATKKPVCEHRSLSTPPLPEACAARHCQGPVIQGQLSRENTQHAWGCYNVTAASATAGSPRILYPSLPRAWVSQSPRISCSFNSVLSERGTDALRRPTCRGRAKSKAEPQELCEQRREREISPSSLRSSGLNLYNQLDARCICGIPEDIKSSQNWGRGLWEQL